MISPLAQFDEFAIRPRVHIRISLPRGNVGANVDFPFSVTPPCDVDIDLMYLGQFVVVLIKLCWIQSLFHFLQHDNVLETLHTLKQ